MENFAIIITEHRKLGFLVLPFWIEKSEASGFTIIEPVTKEHLQQKNYSPTAIEFEIVSIAQKMSEGALYKLFSKEKTIKAFIENISFEIINTRIRPYIDERIVKLFELLSQNNFPLFLRNNKYTNIYESDKIELFKNHSEGVFYFDYDKEELRYSLKIAQDQTIFALTNKIITPITNDPSCFIHQNNLYRLRNIDSKKLQPFLKQNQILIPQRSVKTYFESFVLNTIKSFKVVASGFEILDSNEHPSAILKLDYNLSHQPAFFLNYKYQEKQFSIDAKSMVYVDFQHNDGSYRFNVTKRDIQWEKHIIQTLENSGLYLHPSNSFSTHSLNDSIAPNNYELIDWANKNHQTLSELGVQVDISLQKVNYYMGQFDLQMQVLEKQDWFDLQMVVVVGEHKIPFYKFRTHILNGNREYELPDKTIFIIPEEWLTQYHDILQFASKGNGKEILLKKNHFELLQRLPYQSVEKISEQLKNYSSSEVKIPDGLNAQLRHYQSEGLAWLLFLNSNNFGGILADDMGLGKTLQTIALLWHIYGTKQEANPVQLDLFNQTPSFNHTNIAPSLIVVPTSLVHNWENEVKRFAPKLKVYNYTGSSRLKTKDIAKIFNHYHIVLTSYGTMRNDIDNLALCQFHYLIMDESQNLKNSSSKAFTAIKELKATNFLALTGTPIENGLTDLWSQMELVNPGFLGTASFFKHHFETPITKQKSEERELKLKKLIQPFILRRTKEMAAPELPPISEQVIYCQMDDEQKKLYEREKSGIRNKLFETITQLGVEKSAIIALQALTRLRQLANHPKMVDSNYQGGSGKFTQMMDNIENIVAGNHKVLIFSSFVKDLEIIETEITKRKWQFAKLIGQTRDREREIDKFTNQPEVKIFLISLKAGGVGLNLISADYVFILNPWWNPAAESQAINRAHRIGQTKNVMVYKFLTENSIEEKIAKLQSQKSDLANAFVGANNPIHHLSQEELKELFS